MNSILRREIIKKAQKVFWVYKTSNFVITNVSQLNPLVFPAAWKLVPITLANCYRVGEFRHKSLVPEYQDKISHGEIGLFAEVDGVIVGSIWASVNLLNIPTVVRAYIKLLPGESLIHDIFTGEKCRGTGIGQYMVSGIVETLLTEKDVARIIIDVSVKNGASLKMMDKLGLQSSQVMLYISAFGRLIIQRPLRAGHP
jgi:hypothetical protein